MLYEELQQDAQVAELLKKGNRDLGVLGFTDHSVAHTTLVAERPPIFSASWATPSGSRSWRKSQVCSTTSEIP